MASAWSSLILLLLLPANISGAEIDPRFKLVHRGVIPVDDGSSATAMFGDIVANISSDVASGKRFGQAKRKSSQIFTLKDVAELQPCFNACGANDACVGVYFWASPRRKGIRKVFHCAGLSKLGRKMKNTKIESYSIAKQLGATTTTTATTATKADSVCPELSPKECRASSTCSFDKTTGECSPTSSSSSSSSVDTDTCASAPPKLCRASKGCAYDKVSQTCS
eukprot:gene5489-10882_t